jgi:hypothetical protein
MKLKTLIMTGAVIVGSGAWLGVTAYSQTNSDWGKMMWAKYGPSATPTTVTVQYRFEYAGAPITECPTNSLDAVTNIIIGTDYTGTVQVGTNIWKMSELQKRK